MRQDQSVLCLKELEKFAFSDKINEDEIFEKAIEFEAKNFNKITEEYVIVTHPDDFVFIKEKLENCFGPF